MGSWRDDPGIWAWSAFLRAHATAVRAVDREVQQRTGMPLAWYDVLLELNAAPGRRMRMFDLGEAVVLSRTRVSRIIDDMVTAGLVARETNAEDRRSSYASLTPSGRTAFRRAAPAYLTAIREHFVARLSSRELGTIATAMERVAAAEGRHSEV